MKRKLILFGDSITAGYTEEGMTRLLTDRVATALPDVEIINAGIPGDTTVDGLKRVSEHVVQYQPDIVTLFFGANDAALHRWISVETYQKNLKELISLIGKEKVILLSAPYTSQRNRSQDRPLKRIKDYVEAAKDVGIQLELPVIDMCQRMLDTDDPEKLLQKDGLHFSTAGYDFLTEQLVPIIERKLERLTDDN